MLHCTSHCSLRHCALRCCQWHAAVFTTSHPLTAVSLCFDLCCCAHTATAAWLLQASFLEITSSTFRRWLHLWLKQLAAATKGPLAAAFEACRGVIRCGYQPSMQNLLPFMMAEVAGQSQQGLQLVLQEVSAVMEVRWENILWAEAHVAHCKEEPSSPCSCTQRLGT